MGVQVQTATKYNNGGTLKSLPIIQRQFISFSYGGRDIEDFDLLAVFSGDRLNKEIYAPFKDTTTEQAELDGQLFWRTNFNAGQLNFTLATDGMTSQQLEDFKNWFKPGIEKELILSENHNRGILARVSAAPQMSLLPFEKEVEVTLGEKEERTIGEDENGNPIKKEFLIYYPTKTSLYKGEISLSFVMDDPNWYSLEPLVEKEELEEEDLKLIYEDGIPHFSMLNTSCFLADNHYCTVEKNSNGDIISRTVEENKGIQMSGIFQDDAYLYYCGTGEERPIISFEITPRLDSGNGKISYPSTDDSYYLRLGSESIGEVQELKFGFPSLFSSYNSALDIVSKYEEGASILDIRKELRDLIYNYNTRSWVMAIIDYARKNKVEVSGEGIITSNFEDFFIKQMLNFIPLETPLICTINSKTGEVTIKKKINQYAGGEIDSTTGLLPVNSQTITENAGNMIKSNYLTISTRTLPDKGIINSTNCILVSTNVELNNLKINYKYRYL